jgi:1-acyl-sn-glycerol-3-phosphate acyltransferase
MPRPDPIPTSLNQIPNPEVPSPEELNTVVPDPAVLNTVVPSPALPKPEIPGILQVLYTLYAFLLFVLIILVLAPFVLLFLPLGRIRGANIMYDLFRLMGQLWLMMIGVRHRTSYVASLDPDKQYIFIANHISYIDAVTIICSIKHHFRPIGKHELLRIPVFGFIYRFCVVTVNRSNAEDRARSLNDLRKILARGISIVVFPEGTFNMGSTPMAECYDGAFKLAVETGKTIQPIVFPDALDRLHYRSFFALNPGRSRAIYLDPIDPLSFPELDHKGLKALAVESMSRNLVAAKASWITEIVKQPDRGRKTNHNHESHDNQYIYHHHKNHTDQMDQ